MKIKLILLILFFSIFITNIHAYEIMISPIKVSADDNVKIPGSTISHRIAGSNIFLRPPSLKSAFVSNLLDASKFCEAEGLDNLIYGFLKTEKSKITVELRLYNHENRNIQQTFYASDHIDSIDRLIDDLSLKVHTYFTEELGLYIEKDKPIKPDFISIPLGVGYWVPIDGQWSDFSESLFTIRGGMRFNPDFDLIDHYNMSLNFHFGFSLSYEMAINDPAFEIFYMHRIKFLLPLELRLNIITKHDLSLYLAPLYQMDILDKRRNYDEPQLDISSGFGFSTGLGYHYYFSENFCGGITNNFDFTFYESPQVVYRPELSFVLHSALFKKEKLK